MIIGKTIISYDRLNQKDLIKRRWFWSLIVYVCCIYIDKYQTSTVPIFVKILKKINSPR